MASTKEYLDFILGQLSNLEEITYRSMMKEYILYYRGKLLVVYMMIDYLLSLQKPQFVICQKFDMNYHMMGLKKCCW